MVQISKLDKILVESVNNVYLKPEKDFQFGEPQWFKIVDGKYIRTLFVNNKPACASNDCITGRTVPDNVKQPCAGCEDEDTCTVACRLYLTNLMFGNMYMLNISRQAQAALSQYVSRLLLNNLDAPDVYTKITRLKSGKFSTYTFELGCEDFTEDEVNIIKPITKTYELLTEEEREDFDIVGILKVSGLSAEKLINIDNLIKVQT